MIQPYRSAFRVETMEPAKPIYGLIRAPKPKVHSCGTPGFLYRLWLGMTFRPVRDNSVYRCNECCKVLKLIQRGGDLIISTWEEVDNYREGDREKYWVRKGGATEHKLLSEKSEDND